MNDYSQLDKQSETYDQAIITPEELDAIDNGTINTETILDADITSEPKEQDMEFFDKEATPTTELVEDDNTPYLDESFAIEPDTNVYGPDDFNPPETYQYEEHDLTSYEGKMSFLDKIHTEVFGR